MTLRIVRRAGGIAMTVAVDRSLASRMVRAARLEVDLYEEVERDEGATGQAAIVVLIAGIAAAIAAFITSFIAPTESGNAILAAALGVGGTLIGWILWAAITYWIGKSIFRTAETNVTMGEMLRALGFSHAPGVLGVLAFIPLVGAVVTLIVSLWQLIAGVIAVRQAMDFSTGRAIGTVIVGWLIQVAIIFAIALVIA
jgi:hypothetical protein